MRTALTCWTLATLGVWLHPASAQTPAANAAQPVAPAAAEPDADRRLTQLELRAFQVLASGVSFRQISAADALGQRTGDVADRPNAVRHEQGIPAGAPPTRPLPDDEDVGLSTGAARGALEEPADRWPEDAAAASVPDASAVSLDVSQAPPTVAQHSRDEGAAPPGGNPLRRLLSASSGAARDPNPLRRWFRLSGE